MKKWENLIIFIMIIIKAIVFVMLIMDMKGYGIWNMSENEVDIIIDILNDQNIVDFHEINCEYE